MLGADALFFYNTDAESGQIEITFRVNARHFGGLPADQRAASLLATLGYSANHLFGDFETEFTARIFQQTAPGNMGHREYRYFLG